MVRNFTIRIYVSSFSSFPPLTLLGSPTMVHVPFLSPLSPFFLSSHPPSISFFSSLPSCLSLFSFSLFPEPWLLSHDTASLLPDYVNIRQSVLWSFVKHLLRTVFSLRFNSFEVAELRGMETPRHGGRERQKVLFGKVTAIHPLTPQQSISPKPFSSLELFSCS